MGIIKSENVRSDYTAGYRVSGPPTFEKNGPYKGRAADGGEGEEFYNLFYILPIEEVYPNPRPGQERKVRIKASRTQAQAILANLEEGTETRVTMSPQSALGRFAQSAGQVGLKVDVDSEDMEDRILVLTSESVVNDNNWRDTVWTVRAYLGTTNDYDSGKLATLVDGFNEGIKKVQADY